MGQLVAPVERLHLEASVFHSYYNHHAEEFEIVESTLRFCLNSLKDQFQGCASCLQHFVTDLPVYLNTQIEVLGSLYGNGGDNLAYVTMKLQSLSALSELISSRVE